jgi:hypothetical protein
MTTLGNIRFSELDRKSVAFYTAKWFLIWSLRIFIIGLMVVIAITLFLAAACKEASEHNSDHF